MHKLILILMLLPAWAGAEGAWNHESSDMPTMYQDAANTIRDETYTGDVVPRLAFLCDAGGALSARIDWKRFISSFSTEVGFKVDDGKFSWLKWKVDSSEKVTISPSADDTQKVIDLMSNGTRLRVEISPYSEGPVEVEFDLTGFATELDVLRSSCP